MGIDHDDDGLLRIGIFSTLSRISIRMLRHYQEHGVLEPAMVDPFNERRYYRASQLSQALLIVQLRDAGFPVEAIAQLVNTRDPSRIEAAIEAQRAALSAQRRALHAQLKALDLVSSALMGHSTMTSVSIASLPEMTVASLRKTIHSYDHEGGLWAELMPLLGRSDSEADLIRPTAVDPRLPVPQVGGGSDHAQPAYRCRNPRRGRPGPASLRPRPTYAIARRLFNRRAIALAPYLGAFGFAPPRLQAASGHWRTSPSAVANSLSGRRLKLSGPRAPKAPRATST